MVLLGSAALAVGVTSTSRTMAWLGTAALAASITSTLKYHVQWYSWVAPLSLLV